MIINFILDPGNEHVRKHPHPDTIVDAGDIVGDLDDVPIYTDLKYITYNGVLWKLPYKTLECSSVDIDYDADIPIVTILVAT